MKTVTNELSDAVDFVYEVANEGTQQQTWVNQRLVNRSTDVTFLLTDEEAEKLFKVLY